MANLVGQQLGNYRLVHLLGQGGFADVYLGEHIHLGTQAAIKVLHTQLASDDLEPFRNEARTIARLEHPHIVRVFDFGLQGTTPFLVMSYAPNGTLRKQYPKGTRLPLATIVSYITQIAPALQYAHDQKLIHRDIKPENLLVGRNKEILLSDFGIALVAQSSRNQSTQDMAGTITYMAPEQIQAHPRPASDQYSLGIVVYEWLSGERPFQGSYVEIAIKHNVMPPPSLREQLPHLHPTVEQVVMKALAKDPKQRFASVQRFANAFEQACQAASPDKATLPVWTLPGVIQGGQEQPASWIDNPFTPQQVTSTPPAQAHTLAGVPSPITQPEWPPLPATEPKRPASPFPKVSNRLILLVGLVLLMVVVSTGLIYFLRGGKTTPTSPTVSNQTRNTVTPIYQASFTPTGQATTSLGGLSSNTYPPGGAKLEVNDSLNTTTQGWGVNPPDCQFTAGAYHVHGVKALASCFYTSPFTNFAYEIQMRFIKTDPQNGTCGGIIFRYQTASQFVTGLSTYYSFVICASGSCQFVTAGTTIPLGNSLYNNAACPGLNKDSRQANLLAVVAQGEELSVFVNKMLVTHITNNSVRSGLIGTTLNAPGAEGEVAFNDAKVWTL